MLVLGVYNNILKIILRSLKMCRPKEMALLVSQKLKPEIFILLKHYHFKKVFF